MEKVIKTGLASFGMSGKLFHAPFLEVHPSFELYAVMERSRQLAGEIYPSIRSYASWESLIRDPEIELVVVNTPNYTHYDMARQALEEGKHVIVEKPFTVSAEEGVMLVKLAKENGLLLSVYHNRRFDSDFRTISKVLNEGWLGEIVEAEFHFDRFRTELSTKQHKEEEGPGRGSLYDLGSHLIDQALRLFGRPVALFADITSFRPGSRVDDFFELLLYYPDKRVRLRSSYLVKEALPGYVIHGRKGSFIKSKTDVQEEALLRGIRPGTTGWGREPLEEQGLLHVHTETGILKERIPSLEGNYMDYYEGIYQSLRQGAPLPVDPHEAIEVVEIIETAFASSREGVVKELKTPVHLQAGPVTSESHLF